MDVKTACDAHSGEVIGISSPVVGHADLLIFPNIESGNTFYKTVSLFGDANMAGMLRGTTSSVVVPSRADSGNSKYYSLALACVAGLIMWQCDNLPVCLLAVLCCRMVLAHSQIDKLSKL